MQLRSDHAHAPSALFARRDVGDISLNGRDVGAGHAIDDTVYAVTEINVQAASLDSPGDVTQSIEIEGSTDVFNAGFHEAPVLPADEDGR